MAGTRDAHQQGDDEAPHGATRSEVSGSASDVVQARDVSGGVHFHGSARQANPVPAQLPADIRGFVNRVADLERMDAVLGESVEQPGSASVCVIAGTAGVGKTSLAVRWAHRARRGFPDGQLYVNLRGYDPGKPVSSAQALERFLGALGVAAGAIPTDLESRAALYRSLLADRRVLIVLDNAATAGQVRPLLPGAGRCLVLVTSRSRLSGLITRDGAHRLSLEVFSEPEAVQLLRVTTDGYRVGDDDAEVAELARLCARLPLALRIAAERAAARPRMPLGTLIGDLRDESHLWDALSAEDDDEADAVRSVFAWSYRALPSEAAHFFRLLGLHPGPTFSTHVAAAMADLPYDRTRHLLDLLVGAYLIEQVANDRFQFHDLLRAYALDQVTHTEDPQQRRNVVDRARAWYLHSMAAAVAAFEDVDATVEGLAMIRHDAPGALAFSSHGEALTWFETELDNLIAASRTPGGGPDDKVGWQLPALFRATFVDRHPTSDWLPIGAAALETAQRIGDRYGEAVIQNGLGIVYRSCHRIPEAIASHRAAIARVHEIGNWEQEGYDLASLAVALYRDRRLEEAREACEQCLAIGRERDDRTLMACGLSNLARVLAEGGWLIEADASVREALAILPAETIPTIRGDWLFIQAQIQRELGQTTQAAASIQQALSASHMANNLIFVAIQELELGRLHLVTGNPDGALVALQHASVSFRRLGLDGLEAEALDATGEAYQALHRYEDATNFHRSAAGTHRELGQRWHLAVALTNLATALDALATSSSEAAQYRSEALILIVDYNDPRANELRTRIAATQRSTPL